SISGFGNNLFSCQVAGGVYRFLAQGSCAWVAAGGRVYDRDGSAGDPDVEDTTFNVAAGAQFTTEDAMTFGFAVGYESGETEAGLTNLDRDQLNVGVVGKKRWDAL